ncbi:MAG: glycosyltransferase family 39 protein [Deltaproteobacteria bacterium]|nr:glycosyltransferase family 39 protein [Deltaproteobacteria bacterium]
MLLISLAVPIATAFFIVNMAWPGKDSFQSEFAVKGCLSIGLGLGLSSWLFFTCLVLFGAVTKHFIWFDFILLIICFIFFLYKKKKAYNSNLKPEFVSPDRKWFYYFLYAGFIVLSLIGIISFVLRLLNDPHGSWDAWNIYNLGARFIYRGSTEWATAFSNPYDWSLPDHPLLITGNVARIWSYAGYEALMAPVLQAFLFTSATVILTVFSVSRLQNKNQGLIAGMVLLGTPFFIYNGSSLIADVPVGFYILATVVLYCFIDEGTKKKPGLIFICGAMAGCAAWTKDEGLLLIAAIFIARFIVVTLQKGLGAFFKEAVIFSAGLTPVLIIIAYFKFLLVSQNIVYLKDQLAPPGTHIFNQDFNVLLNSLTDIKNYIMIGKTFLIKFYELEKWMLVVFPVFILLMGRSDKKQNNPGIYTSLLILMIMICGYFTVFLVYPLDNLEWLLEMTVKRLLLQILPSFIFVFFLITAAPEETA